LRLGMGERISQRLPIELSLPAGGQGAVGIELRVDDAAVVALVRPLHHEVTAYCVQAERALNTRLQGGCQVPIAAFAQYEAGADQALWLRGLVGSTDGTRILRAEARGDHTDPEQLGIAVAEDLLSQGAAELLAAIHG